MGYSMEIALISVATVAAVASLIADHKNLTLQRYLFKPLPILLMIVVVMSAEQVSPTIRTVFAMALGMSALGDVLLIDRRRFLFGLGAFLVAHLLYIAGMWLSQVGEPRFITLLPLTIWGGVMFWVLRDGLAQMRIPVLFYISIILIMIWLAFEYHHQVGDRGSLFLLSGALLFGLSDTVLAIDHFKKPFKGSKALILITYYAAQFFIAYSLVFRGVKVLA